MAEMNSGAVFIAFVMPSRASFLNLFLAQHALPPERA